MISCFWAGENIFSISVTWIKGTLPSRSLDSLTRFLDRDSRFAAEPTLWNPDIVATERTRLDSVHSPLRLLSRGPPSAYSGDWQDFVAQEPKRAGDLRLVQDRTPRRGQRMPVDCE